MNSSDAAKAADYITTLCERIPERCVGSEGNRMATRFFSEELCAAEWETECQEFDAIDWRDGGASLTVAGASFDVHVSPYSPGCDVEGKLVAAASLEDLKRLDARDAIIVLWGEIAVEQLMPKNFVFYNPEQHRAIVSELENSGAKALVCATGRNAALAGGLYPFPLLEDGDFDIPSVYMTDTEGERLRSHIGEMVYLRSDSERIPGTGCNVIGYKGARSAPRIVITAHIDAKKGAPGAIDNATGVTALILAAQRLSSYSGDKRVELIAFNGEDYYSVPGQMRFVQENQKKFDSILLNINIDGAGYKVGKSAFSLYGVPDKIGEQARQAFAAFQGIAEGPQWPQGDHSIFVQFGVPAIALSSEWFISNIDSQQITHTPADNPGIVDPTKVVELAEALAALVKTL